MLKYFKNLPSLPKPPISLPKISRPNKSWARVAISVLLVIGVTAGLWFASPTPVEAVTISFPSTPAGTQGSSHTFTVRVDITGATDLLPVQSIDIWVKDQTGAYSYNLTGVPLLYNITFKWQKNHKQ